MRAHALSTLSLGIALLAYSAVADAADRAFVGAKVVMASGELRPATVLVSGKRITAVDPSLTIPAGAEVIKLEGKVLSPGLVASLTQLGLVEVSLEAYTRDTNSGLADPVRAAFQVADAYNPRSSLIPITRREGITSAVTNPSGGLVAGQPAWVDLAGGTQAESVVQASLAVRINLSSGEKTSRSAKFFRFRELLDEARRFSEHSKEWEQRRYRDFSTSPKNLKALARVASGELPIMVHLSRASDIEALLRLLDEEGLRAIIIGGAEAWMHAKALAKRKVPVIVDALQYTVGSFDEVHARPDNVVLLEKAGVPVILSVTGFATHNARKLRQIAGNAVRGGLSHAAALKAITATPAAAFGMKEHGVIEAGRLANLVVWSGDPLELSSFAERVFIHGREVSLETRQTRLRDRYRKLPGSPTPPLPLPVK